jgi:sterol desaturase/sphingolipid hydroxylase (fatty acid hydroxylase superfamily)
MRDTALAVVRQFLLFEALLAPLELLWPVHAGRRRGFATNLVHFALNPFLVNAGSALFLGALGTALTRLTPTGVRAALAAQPFAAQLVEVFLLSEVGSYWAHRLAHRVPALWQLHAIHHSSEQMGWLAAHRQHPLETIWFLGVSNLPALALGFNFGPLAGLVLAQKLYTAFLHANLRLDYGRATRLFASPRFHHWHHQADRRPAANFAAALSICDVVWGTWDVPPGYPRRLGVEPSVGEGYLRQIAAPILPYFAGLRSRMRSASLRLRPQR